MGWEILVILGLVVAFFLYIFFDIVVLLFIAFAVMCGVVFLAGWAFLAWIASFRNRK